MSFFPVAWLSGLSFDEVALRCAVSRRRYGGGRWLEIVGETFASIVGVVGIVLLAIAA